MHNREAAEQSCGDQERAGNDRIAPTTMSQARPKPFRFTALPRELQERIASELDLGSLGRLSSTSKKLRASLVSVAGLKWETPVITMTIIP